MYTEIKNAIEAAEEFESQLQWWKDSLETEIERLMNIEERDEWDNAQLAKLLAKRELYNNVMTSAHKWVKSQL